LLVAIGDHGRNLVILLRLGDKETINGVAAVLLISADAIKGYFEGKMPREVHQGGLVLARQCPFSPGTCNLEETDLPGLSVS